MKIYKISPRFTLCNGEIGVDNFSEFLGQLPRIDLVYAAPPKPEYFSMWYGLMEKEKLPHGVFYSALFEILKIIDALEYHIEVGESNEQMMRSFFSEWKPFDHQQRSLLYSAPTNHKNRLTKCRKPTKIIVMSHHQVRMMPGRYSHEYLDQLLDKPEKLNVFDPVIGKGLLARYAIKYGHSCFGIEMNPDRLNCTLRFITENLSEVK